MTIKTTHIAMLGIILGAAAIVLALCFVDSPSEARAIRFDRLREDNVNNITGAVQSYFERKQVLPKDLEELKKDNAGYWVVTVDPRTGVAYEYITTGTSTYQLCATFERESTDRSSMVPRGYYNGTEHGVGRHCFSREVVIPTNNGIAPPKPIITQ